MIKNIGYLGIPGSYSHTAACRYFSSEENKCDFSGLKDFAEVFRFAASGRLNFGVIPIENSLAGSIYENYDLLDINKLHIVGEYYLRIEHHLLVAKGGVNTIGRIKEVYSHPKAIEQCAQFFTRNPELRVHYTADTANAAKYVSENSKSHIAAIASKECGGFYGLDILSQEVANNPENYTRFLILSKNAVEKNQANKASLAVHLNHETGSLAHLLNVLVDNNCNLTKIESRPLIGKPFEYIFYLDFQYNSKEHKIDKIINELDNSASSAKLIGLYKSGSLGQQ